MTRASLLLCCAAVGIASAGCDICDGTDGIAGSFVLRTQQDVDAFPDGKCVRGDLSIGAPNGQFAVNDSIRDLGTLAHIEIVEGAVAVDGNKALVTLSLPALTFAGRRLIDPEANGSDVRGAFFIIGNQSLTTLDLPALTDVGSCFQVVQNGALDPATVDAIFRRVRSHAFPGACNLGDQKGVAIEDNSDNGTGFVPAGGGP